LNEIRVDNDALLAVSGNDTQHAEAYIREEHYLERRSYKDAVLELQKVLSRGLRSFYRRAYRILRNTADAEDAVQDAVLSAWAHIGQFRGEAQMSSWLTAIVINSARIKLRRRPSQPHVGLDETTREQDIPASDLVSDHRPSPEEMCRRKEFDERLMRALAQLPPALRKTFLARDVEGLSIRETAALLGVPCGTVKTRLSRARVKLKKIMTKNFKDRASRFESFRAEGAGIPACTTQ
jgi:RNA polymerase sigma-70 factor, ECF subfamily